MPESKRAAQARARRVGIPVRNVVKASSGGHFIAPRGVSSGKGKRAYAECRAAR
jgi:hypothetical protein